MAHSFHKRRVLEGLKVTRRANGRGHNNIVGPSCWSGRCWMLLAVVCKRVQQLATMWRHAMFQVSSFKFIKKKYNGKDTTRLYFVNLQFGCHLVSSWTGCLLRLAVTRFNWSKQLTSVFVFFLPFLGGSIISCSISSRSSSYSAIIMIILLW